ncbi:MCE family protein [Actinomycetes bacterium KLBMP 9797]
MIRLGTKLQVLAFLVASLLGVSYVAVRYVGLGGGGYVVHVDLADAGGIFANAAVTYRGSPVGRVTAVRLHGDGVRADLRLEQEVRVPSDLRAVVAQRSAVGEQYVDLRPNRDTGPFLSEGSVIPRDRTGTPIAAETLLTNLDALVRSVDPEDLAVVIDELGTAFEGNELALQTIVDASDALLADAVANLPQTVALIRDGRTALAAQQASADAIRRWAKGLAEVSATLRQSDPDLRRLLTNAPPAATELVALLRELDPTVGTLLGNLVTVNGIAVRRLPAIEHLLVVYPLTVAGGFTVTPGDGTAHLGLVVNLSDPPSCVYADATRCTGAEQSRGASVRGTNNAPRPGGRDPAPAARADPATGLVTGSDGAPLWFGGTGGQYQLTGDQSWKQLLLAGLAP